MREVAGGGGGGPADGLILRSTHYSGTRSSLLAPGSDSSERVPVVGVALYILSTLSVFTSRVASASSCLLCCVFLPVLASGNRMSARDFALLRAKMQVALGKSGFLPGVSLFLF